MRIPFCFSCFGVAFIGTLVFASDLISFGFIVVWENSVLISCTFF